MDNSVSLEPEALLENVGGWVLTLLKEDIQNSGAWEKLANLCKDTKSQPIFSNKDISRIGNCKFPGEALIDEFLKRSMTLKYLCYILEKAELTETLWHLKEPEEAQIIRQSLEGIVYVPYKEEIVIILEVSGFPPPKFLWYKEENPLITQDTNILKIENFGPKDEGIYLCLVEQSFTDKEHVLWSEPTELCLKQTVPCIINHPQDKDLTEGQKLQLHCETKAYPDPIFTWYKDGELTASSYSENSFTIESVRLTDAGSYKCIVANSEGEAESNVASVNISPKGDSSDAPHIVQHPLLCEENTERSIGQSISLLCSARCSENVTFTWVVNGHSLESTLSTQHTITSASSPPDYSSSLFYIVSHDDGTSIRILCIVQSPQASQISNEVKIKISSSTGPKVYQAGTKWALLVANTDYSVEPLPQLYTPSSDMQLVAKELNDLGFHCLLLTNLNLTEFQNAVKLFANMINSGDYVIFCYAGHGLFSGVDLLMPVPDENSAHELETLSSLWIRSILQMNHPALLFIILDMCRHIHLRHLELPLETVKLPPQRSSIVLHATSEGYQSLEDPKTSSVLTSSLVQHLQDDVDVVTMARAVLQDIAHKSQFVRCEQIPKLEVNLCDNRSLKDPSKFLDAHMEKVWAALVELPAEKFLKKRVCGHDVAVRVFCTGGGTSNLVSNVMLIHLEIITDSVPPQMTLALNVKNEIKSLGRKNNRLIYEMNAVQKVKEPLVLTIGFRNPNMGGVTKETIHLGVPGIAKVKLYNEKDTVTTVRARNVTHNIP